MINHSDKALDNKGFHHLIKRNMGNLVKYAVNAFYLISFERDHDHMISLFAADTDSSIKTMEMKANQLAEKAIQRLISSSPEFPCYPLLILNNIIIEMPFKLHPGVEYESTLLGRFIKTFCEDGIRSIGTRIAILRYFYGYDVNHIYSLLNEDEANINKAFWRWKKDCLGKKDKYNLSGFLKEDVLNVIKEIESHSAEELNRKVDNLFKFYSECSVFYSIDCFNTSLSEELRLKRCKKRYENKVDYEYRTWCLPFNRECIRNVRSLIEFHSRDFDNLSLPHPPDEIRLSETLKEWIYD